MACFVVPAVLAVLVSVARRVARGVAERVGLGLLEGLLWGGAGLLALEHLWHGELVPWPPFLTAMRSPDEWAVALHEMSTNGVAMTLATVGIWGSVLLLQRRSAGARWAPAGRRVTATLPEGSQS